MLEEVDRSPALELLILQSIAGRQGRWAVREAEVKDAKIGRDLLRGLGPIDPLGARAKLEGAKAAYFAGSYLEASRLLADADRCERTIDGSIQLAVALWRAGSIDAAVWAIRVALLEDRHCYDLRTLLHAHRIESSLRLLHEQHGEFGAGELGAWPCSPKIWRDRCPARVVRLRPVRSLAAPPQPRLWSVAVLQSPRGAGSDFPFALPGAKLRRWVGRPIAPSAAERSSMPSGKWWPRPAMSGRRFR